MRDKLLLSLLLPLLAIWTNREAEGDLKPHVVTDHKVPFCKVRCTPKLKADGPRSMTSGRGLTSKSIQKLQCRSEERKAPKSLGNETSGGHGRHAEGFCSADRLSSPFFYGFPWGALED